MKSRTVLLAALAGFSLFAVSCDPIEKPEEKFIFEALQIKGLELQIMDRNVGAQSVDDPGDYYQYGKNTPVANGLNAVLNTEYSADWSLTSAGAADWSVPANTPCPEGWRLPNADDIKAMDKALEAIAYYEFDMATKEEYNAAKETLASMGLIPTGKFQEGKDGLYLPDANYFWTAVCDKTAGTATMFENNNFPTFGKKNSPATAAPVRCVK